MIYFQLIITQRLVWTPRHPQRECQQSAMNSAQERLQGPCFSCLQIILFNLLTFIPKLSLKINVQRVKIAAASMKESIPRLSWRCEVNFGLFWWNCRSCLNKNWATFKAAESSKVLFFVFFLKSHHSWINAENVKLWCRVVMLLCKMFYSKHLVDDRHNVSGDFWDQSSVLLTDLNLSGTLNPESCIWSRTCTFSFFFLVICGPSCRVSTHDSKLMYLYLTKKSLNYSCLPSFLRLGPFPRCPGLACLILRCPHH